MVLTEEATNSSVALGALKSKIMERNVWICTVVIRDTWDTRSKRDNDPGFIYRRPWKKISEKSD